MSTRGAMPAALTTSRRSLRERAGTSIRRSRQPHLRRKPATCYGASTLECQARRVNTDDLATRDLFFFSRLC